MRRKQPPHACPRCDSSCVDRILWHCVHLCGQNEEDVIAGRAIFGSRGMVPGAPTWACLACTPQWSSLHRLALEEYDWQLAKEEPVAKMDFDRACELRGLQVNRNQELAALVQKLLRGHASEAQPEA